MINESAQGRAARFVGALRQLQTKRDRGSLAALRRGLSHATAREAWPVVARLGGEIGVPGECVYVDIAALYATHPFESSTGNFGDTCRALGSDGKAGVQDSYEGRFRRLLSADSPEDLVGQLRSWVRLAAGKGVGINYESLFLDLLFWRSSSEDIRVCWARSFWRSAQSADSAGIATRSEPAHITPQ